MREGLTPSLEIRSVVAGDAAAAVEMVEHYRYEGADKVAVIAAFFAFDGPPIKRVKVYNDGSATHNSQAACAASVSASLRRADSVARRPEPR